VRIAATCAALAVLAGPASAQTSDVTEERQMTLQKSGILVQAFLEISLSQDAVAKPISLAPDVWYGVSDILTVGLVHSSRAATGLLGTAGDGLCLTGSDNGCAKFYNSVGVDGRYHLYRAGNITVSADSGLFARSFDPFALALKAGAVGRWESGQLAFEAAPSLFLGVTERQGYNKEQLILPGTALYAITPKIGLAGQLGIVLPVEDAGNLFLLGLSVGAQYMVSDKISADATFSLPALVGGDAVVNDGAKGRIFTLGGSYAL